MFPSGTDNGLFNGFNQVNDIDGSGTIVDNDNDDDGVCDLDELGLVNGETACNYGANYNPLANTDDGSCEPIVYGCMRLLVIIIHILIQKLLHVSSGCGDLFW